MRLAQLFSLRKAYRWVSGITYGSDVQGHPSQVIWEALVPPPGSKSHAGLWIQWAAIGPEAMMTKLTKVRVWGDLYDIPED